MREPSYESISDDELLTAFAEARNDIYDGPLKNLLEMIVDRLIETGKVFNEHEHPVSGVRTESCEYYSAGDGHTGTPAARGGYGCGKAQRIGHKREDDY